MARGDKIVKVGEATWQTGDDFPRNPDDPDTYPTFGIDIDDHANAIEVYTSPEDRDSILQAMADWPKVAKVGSLERALEREVQLRREEIQKHSNIKYLAELRARQPELVLDIRRNRPPAQSGYLLSVSGSLVSARASCYTRVCHNGVQLASAVVEALFPPLEKRTTRTRMEEVVRALRQATDELERSLNDG